MSLMVKAEPYTCFFLNILLSMKKEVELTHAPQPPSPSPEGEGVQGMRQLKIHLFRHPFGDHPGIK